MHSQEFDVITNHIACVIIAIHSSEINPKSHDYNSLQHSNLQLFHAKIAGQNMLFGKLLKAHYVRSHSNAKWDYFIGYEIISFNMKLKISRFYGENGAIIRQLSRKTKEVCRWICQH